MIGAVAIAMLVEVANACSTSTGAACDIDTSGGAVFDAIRYTCQSHLEIFDVLSALLVAIVVDLNLCIGLGDTDEEPAGDKDGSEVIHDERTSE